MNQSQRERLVVVLGRAMQAALTESPDRVRALLEEALRDLTPAREAAASSSARPEGRRPRPVEVEVPREPELPFHEDQHVRALAGFLDVLVMASGHVGRRTADRLLRRTFGEHARGAERWLTAQGLVQAAGDEGLQITEDGLRYVDRNREGKTRSYVGFEVDPGRRGA
jgi:hypothetical protein